MNQRNPEPKNDAPSGAASAEASSKRPANPMVRILGAVALVVVLVIALIAGIRYISYASTHQTTDDATVDADVVSVTSKIAERVESIEVGTNQFVHRGQVLIRLDEHDERRRYDSARAVLRAQQAQAAAARQTVALTVDQQQAQVAQGNGSIQQAKAGIAGARQQAVQSAAEVRVAQSAVETSLAQLRAAQAVLPGLDQALDRANADLERTKALTKTGDASRAQLDAARSTAASAASSRQQALANVQVARTNVASAQEKRNAQSAALASARDTVAIQAASLQTAQGKLSEVASPYRVSSQQSAEGVSLAQVATQESQVRQALDQLQYTTIRAPIDGYVGQKAVQVGQTVAPGQTLITLVPGSRVFVTANFKETQIGDMRAGQRVDVRIDAYHGRDFSGYVEAIAPASQATYSLIPAQNATGNFVKVTQRIPVRIMVDQGVDEAHPLRVGMSVEASVRVKE